MMKKRCAEGGKNGEKLAKVVKSVSNQPKTVSNGVVDNKNGMIFRHEKHGKVNQRMVVVLGKAVAPVLPKRVEYKPVKSRYDQSVPDYFDQNEVRCNPRTGEVIEYDEYSQVSR